MQVTSANFETHLNTPKHHNLLPYPPSLLLGALPWPSRGWRREADYSPTSSAEFKSAWSHRPTPPYVFMSWCLIKHNNNYYYYYCCYYYYYFMCDGHRDMLFTSSIPVSPCQHLSTNSPHSFTHISLTLHNLSN
jgi:hypothetical protein